MPDLPVAPNPVFSETMEQITTQNRGAPDTFNPRYQILLDNDNYLKNQMDRQMVVTQATLSMYDWSAQSPYTQTINIEGVGDDDCPILSKCVDLASDVEQTYEEAYNIIAKGYAKCGEGSITFSVEDKPVRDITVNLLFGRKGDGYVLMTGGGGSAEKQQISNVVMTITDNAAVAEGGAVTAECNGKSWTSTIKNGKAKLYASEVGNYTITVVTTDAEPVTYTTMLVCPYFGQFSTDIYSGTLMVTCTEEGGNGKSCNVRSCDDEYNVTDAYNLTQAFDTGLELTFLGIPSGKYLVTVDDKYVFFKEIQSIQNINSVDICLRQYLYRNGDQCPWNTGGWRQCLYFSEAYRVGDYSGASTGIVEKNIIFAENSITMSGSIACKVVMNSGGVRYRGGGKFDIYIGTIKPLSMPIQKYSSMQISGTNADINYSIRTGSPNDENTNTSTATILQAGSGLNADLKLDEQKPYLVLGKGIYQSATSSGGGLSDVNISYTNEIEELFLV